MKNQNNSKSAHFSDVSHELRSPLIIIKEALNLMSTYIPDKSEKSHGKIMTLIKMAQRNIDYITGIITRFLDISILESNRITINKKKISPGMLIKTVMNELKFYSEKKKIKLALKVHNKIRKIYIDPVLIKQVLINLIENAIKFTSSSGKVSVEVVDNGQFLSVDVVDTGIGILPQYLHRIFDKFYKVSDSGNMYSFYSGAGLGLAISKKIIELHNGKIWVESKFRQGSKFIFLLPYG